MLVSNSAFTIRCALSSDRPSRLPCACPTGQTHRPCAHRAVFRDNRRLPDGSKPRAIASLFSTIRPALESGRRRGRPASASLYPFAARYMISLLYINNAKRSSRRPQDVRLQQRVEDVVGRRRYAQVAAELDDLAREPGQLQPVAAFEVERH